MFSLHESRTRQGCLTIGQCIKTSENPMCMSVTTSIVTASTLFRNNGAVPYQPVLENWVLFPLSDAHMASDANLSWLHDAGGLVLSCRLHQY